MVPPQDRSLQHALWRISVVALRFWGVRVSGVGVVVRHFDQRPTDLGIGLVSNVKAKPQGDRFRLWGFKGRGSAV